VNLALLYLKGQGVAQDEPKGFELLRQAAEAGAPDAQFQMGMDYSQGTHGMKHDENEAREWFRKAAAQGNVRAQGMLDHLKPSESDMSQDAVQTAESFRKNAEQGNANAQYRLGLCYSRGKGVPQSYEQAAAWYLLAANQNDAEALLDLGLLYSDGLGVPKDTKKALDLFRRSAELGKSDAQYRVGLAYDMGQGVEKNEEEAIKWYRKSAEQGFTGAQFNLAMRLSNQPAEMYFWLSLAAPKLQGEPLAMAIKIRDLAAGLLKPSGRAEADERVKKWQAAHHN